MIRKDGAYTFDGAQVRHKSFSEAPLPFDKARCLDFYGGDLQGIIDSIPYFKELGITCLYLNPIGDSRTTHRYDCCDFFHVDPKLGGDEMFEKLVKELHKNGIRIIIDISINHTGTENLWFKKALADKNCEEASFYYFDENGKPSYWEGVPTLPQLNYGSEKLRQLIYKDKDSVLRKFLKEPYCQNGWRFDVANVVGRHGSDQFCKEIWKEVHKAVKEENSQAYMVGECWVDATAYLQGDMWDATMNYVGCSRPLRRWMGEIDRFQMEGWGTDPGSTIPYSGTDLRTALQSQLESLPTQMCFLQMNLFDSHDTPRLHTNTETMDKKLYAGIVMLTYLLPGMPSIYYGDEIQLAGDVHSVEAWRYPMEWDRSKWDMDIHHLYCVLGKLRRDWAEVLGNGSFAFLAADSKTMVFARYTTNQALILILNRGKARSFSFRTCQLNGKKTAVLMGSGSAEAVPDAILCHLEERESLLLALT
ncbi:MAG: alpha-amylase family glycosyl hydrolase [Spirochaetia bacterium]|nr:alpha-amylase family glycosyl hydrolase [Spirochaetia bacterium]